MKDTLRLIAAGAIGNVLEWYDFAIYGYFAFSIGQNFFPKSDPVAQVLAAFGVFAVGYLMRPFGGALTGTIADRYGRQAGLTFSVVAMAVPTFLVGLLPGYDTIGIMAPVLLTLLRMVQGLAIAGECTTSFTFMIEHAPLGRRGLVGALSSASAGIGMLLGSGGGTFMASLLTVDQLHQWGWRVPFLLGLGVGIIGFLLRRGIHGTIPDPRQQAGKSPLHAILAQDKRLLLRLAGVAAFGAVSFYLMFLYVVTWLQTIDGVAPVRALGINTVSMIAMIPVTMLAGWLSDRMGRKPILMAGVLLGGIGAFPFLWLMHHSNPALILAGQFGFVLSVGTALGVQPSLMVEATPPAIRCTVIALGFNLSFGLLGGLSPLAAAWLVQRTDMDLTPAYMIMAAAALSFVVLLTFERRTSLAAATS
ncbi:MAG: MFS transporter [Alphaproteobacteria bacterium]|nr:MFS transporter [Alphaproteobacteria bacterium]